MKPLTNDFDYWFLASKAFIASRIDSHRTTSPLEACHCDHQPIHVATPAKWSSARLTARRTSRDVTAGPCQKQSASGTNETCIPLLQTHSARLTAPRTLRDMTAGPCQKQPSARLIDGSLDARLTSELHMALRPRTVRLKRGLSAAADGVSMFHSHGSLTARTSERS